MATIYPVHFNAGCENSHIVFVAFDREAATKFAAAENNQAGCDIMTVDELPLFDRYGFPCLRSEAAIVAPWVRNVSIDAMRHYAPEYQARRDREYIREMSMGG